MGRELRRGLVIVVVGAALTCVTAAAHAADRVLSPATVKAGFRAATGDRLIVDRPASWAGVTALALRYGTSQSARARYGTFRVYVYGRAHLAGVAEALADTHTGEPIEPDAQGVRWERSTTIHGEPIWTAKSVYAANVVLVWDSAGPKRVTRAWRRLHRALSSTAAG